MDGGNDGENEIQKFFENTALFNDFAGFFIVFHVEFFSNNP